MQTDKHEMYQIPEMEIIALEMAVVTFNSGEDPNNSENFDEVFGVGNI